MKRFVAIILAVFCLIAVFSGCEKVDRNSELTTSGTTVETVTIPEPETIYNEKNRTLKTINKDTEGNVISISVIVYNEDKTIEKESVYDSEDKLVSSVSYKYDKNKNFIEKAYYTADNKLDYMLKDYVYKEVKKGDKTEFLLIEYKRYNSKLENDTVYKYIYDKDNNCTGMESYSPDGNLITKNEF